MKINKLFHWLYAFVMFLPIFAIGVTCLTSLWNKNIVSDNEHTTINYRYQTKEVNTIDDIQTGYIYTCILSKVDNLGQNIFTNEITIQQGNNNYIIYDSLYRVNVDTNYVYLFDTAGLKALITYDSNNQLIIGAVCNPLTKTNSTYPLTSFTTYTGYNPIESVDITTEPTEFDTKNVFYYAVDKVTESPLFSWAYDSFLVAPFAYIVSLFSMPTNSPVVMLLSYWLAISIIWLVFDLIMYIPLLVHRWLDKGVLE